MLSLIVAFVVGVIVGIAITEIHRMKEEREAMVDES